MRLLLLLFILLSLNHYQLQSQSQHLSGSFKLDTTNTKIEFSAKHFGVLKVSGTFHQFTGHLELEKSQIKSGSLTIQVSSITTWNKGRDRSLQSEDFLNANAFPQIQLDVVDSTPNQKPIQISAIIKGVKEQFYLNYQVQTIDSSLYQILAECTVSRKAFQLFFGHMDDLVSDVIYVKATVSLKQKNP